MNVFKKWANERNLHTTFEDHESEALDQPLSQFYTFRNSVILASLLLTSNCMEAGNIKGKYHLCLHKLLKLPESCSLYKQCAVGLCFVF